MKMICLGVSTIMICTKRSLKQGTLNTMANIQLLGFHQKPATHQVS